MKKAKPFHFAGIDVRRGTSKRIELPAGRLPSGTELSMPVQVLHGANPGPTVWLSGALHGDEIVGVEIIRQAIASIDLKQLHGTILAVPVVNVFGFVSQSRYLPDRRDLNRSFPGSARGSLAGRLARLFLTQVVDLCDVGIDFHAGSDDRTNLPQIRGNMEDAETRRLASAFGGPLMIHSKTIPGSLREAARRRGKTILLFEGGEPRRFNPGPVEAGTAGTLRTLAALGMVSDPPPVTTPTHFSRSTRWVRAPRGGIFHSDVLLGQVVAEGDTIGVIADPAVKRGRDVTSRIGGVVMGHTVSPLVHQGDALVHIAEIETD